MYDARLCCSAGCTRVFVHTREDGNVLIGRSKQGRNVEIPYLLASAFYSVMMAIVSEAPDMHRTM